jgi:tetratricopeptide (TPR) repeat protein
VAADFRRVTLDLDAALDEAESLLESRDALGAAIQVGTVLATEPDHVPALVLMARSQLALSHPETAVTAAERAFELAPGDGAVADVLSAALTATGRHDEAVLVAGQAVRLDPRLAARYDRLARALLGAERFRDAEEAARTAEMLAPGGPPDRLLILAAAQACLGRRNQARRTLLAALELDPRHVEARELLLGLKAPIRESARRSSGNRAMVVPAAAMVLVALVLLLAGATAPAVTCLVLGAVLLLGGFLGNRSR